MENTEAINANGVEVLLQLPVPMVLAKLEKELESLKEVNDTCYKTSGNIDSINIKSESQISNLIKCYGSVLAREDVYHRSAKDLGLNTYPDFVLNGMSVSDIKHDIQLRMKILAHHDRKTALEKSYEEIKTFLSQQDQQLLAMQRVAQILGS